jgi:excisionase family DNA binding protein
MTPRTSNPPRSPTSKAASRTTGTGVRGRPVRLHTIDETAELLNVSPRTVRRLIEAGALRAHRIGRRLVRISDEDIAAFLAANRSA